VNHGNLLADAPAALAGEDLRTLLTTPDLRIERIVSTGQASPPGFWYDQATLLIEGEAAPRLLTPGSYLHLPAHCRHRVEWTSTDTPTVWLAVHHR
jgi:cupin 2 domain-containing protein